MSQVRTKFREAFVAQQGWEIAVLVEETFDFHNTFTSASGSACPLRAFVGMHAATLSFIGPETNFVQYIQVLRAQPVLLVFVLISQVVAENG